MFELLFMSPRGQDDQPMAHGFLKSDTLHAPSELTSGQVVVTPPASTLAAFNYQVTQLHGELEVTREAAREEFEGIEWSVTAVFDGQPFERACRQCTPPAHPRPRWPRPVA